MSPCLSRQLGYKTQVRTLKKTGQKYQSSQHLAFKALKNFLRPCTGEPNTNKTTAKPKYARPHIWTSIVEIKIHFSPILP